jgi:signal transduction histidine kinase
MSDVPTPRSRTTTVATSIAAVVVAVAGAIVAVWARAGGTADLGSAVSLGATITAVTVVGAVLTLARPDNRVGWLMLIAGAVWGAGEGCFDAGIRGILTAPGSVPAADALAVIGTALRACGWLGAAVGVMVIFPDGRPRWRWLAWVAAAAVVASAVGTALAADVESDQLRNAGWHNPLPVPAVVNAVGDGLASLSLPLMVVTVIGSVAAMISRWRRRDVPTRRQLLTFAIAVVVPVVIIPTAFGAGAPPWIFAASLIPLPVAVAVAVLTGGVFDLATVANRSLVWATLSVVVAATYALVIAGAGAVLGRSDVRWLPWLGAGVVAISFAPLRDALQTSANRITYGRWRRPYDVLAGLGTRVEAAADTDRALADVVAELHAALGLVGVALRATDGRIVAGSPDERSTVVGLVAYGQRTGELLYTEPASPLRASDRAVLDDLAAQLAVLMHARALTADLQAARERLVVAREEERRRLRRDLHDGLGPALAGLMLKVDNARALLPDDATGAERDLLALRDEIQVTVADVRRLVEGLRPPAIDELGLGPALTQAVNRLAGRAGTAIQVSVPEPLPSVPAAVEVALYRIVSEAVTNTVRHAHATTCAVALTTLDGTLVATVTDDGRGLNGSASGGNGLATMRERAEELGGTLEVRSHGMGTTVTATLPLPAPRRTGDGT